jgi:hypothetical protein
VQNYPPDPGGVFASDYHRRVAAHLPVPDDDPVEVEDLLERLDEDVYTPIDALDRVALEAVLTELAASKDAKELKAGWRLAAAGLAKLTGPALTELVSVEGELVRAEPPPMEGVRLEEAEAQTRRVEVEDAEIEQRGKVRRLELAEEELAAAKAAMEED